MKHKVLLTLLITLCLSCSNGENKPTLGERITNFCERAYEVSKDGNVYYFIDIMYEVGEFSDTLTVEEFEIAIDKIREWNKNNYFKSRVTHSFYSTNIQHIPSNLYMCCKGYIVDGVVQKYSFGGGKCLNLNYYLIDIDSYEPEIEELE